MSGNSVISTNRCSLPLTPKYAKWFENVATTFTTIDRKMSQKLSKRAEIKQCYANCARNERPGLAYYEGFMLMPSLGMWFHHAFLVHDGMVCDPTLAINDRIESGTTYMGIEFQRAIVKMHEKDKTFSPLLDDLFIEECGNVGC